MGSSLSVNNVQALGSDKVDEVLEIHHNIVGARKIKPGLSWDSHLQIPILDFSKLFTLHCWEGELMKDKVLIIKELIR